MNKHFSLLIHSLLIVGALLPLSPIASSVQPVSTQPTVQPTVLPADASQLVAFGSGAPRYRGGGGTR